jgi:hypothetical protein
VFLISNDVAYSLRLNRGKNNSTDPLDPEASQISKKQLAGDQQSLYTEL